MHKNLPFYPITFTVGDNYCEIEKWYNDHDGNDEDDGNDDNRNNNNNNSDDDDIRLNGLAYGK